MTPLGTPNKDGGLIHHSVEANSPAAKAGLEAGDVITKVGGDRMRTVAELRDQLRLKREAKTVMLSVILRDGTGPLSAALFIFDFFLTPGKFATAG